LAPYHVTSASSKSRRNGWPTKRQSGRYGVDHQQKGMAAHLHQDTVSVALHAASLGERGGQGIYHPALPVSEI
jgi:hypothetical protein